MQNNTPKNEIRNKKGHYIFRATRRNPKTGEIEHAKKFGKKAFKIWVND